MSGSLISLRQHAFTLVALIAVLAMLSGCGSHAPRSQADMPKSYYASMEYDPFESFNRAMYHVNRTLDGVLIRPVTKIYRGVVPELGRKSISNFLSNLASPITLVNSVLQGDPENAFKTFWRFVFNTTFGLGGIIDVAGYYGMHAHTEDFGQTMGVYGATPGPYIYLPIIGPSSGRDLPGRVVDIFTDPFNYLLSDGWIAARAGATAVDARSRNFNLIDSIYRDSLDPYATFRSGYLQRRKAEIENKGWNKSPRKD